MLDHCTFFLIRKGKLCDEKRDLNYYVFKGIHFLFPGKRIRKTFKCNLCVIKDLNDVFHSVENKVIQGTLRAQIVTFAESLIWTLL